MMSRLRSTFSSTSDIISRLDECRVSSRFTGRYTCRALASRSRQFDLRGLRAVSVGGARVWPAGSRVESVREDARLFSCEGRMKDV